MSGNRFITDSYQLRQVAATALPSWRLGDQEPWSSRKDATESIACWSPCANSFFNCRSRKGAKKDYGSRHMNCVQQRMHYLALACDYDGTLATDGRVSDATLAALKRLPVTGRKLILVTGRELPDLLAIFPPVLLFERVVAENGGLLYRPAEREEKRLAAPAPGPF